MSKVSGVSAASSQIRFGLPSSIWLLPSHVYENMDRWGEHGSPETAGERARDPVTLTLFSAECVSAMRPWVCLKVLGNPLDGKKGSLCRLLANSSRFSCAICLFFSGQQATHRDVFFSSIKTVFEALEVNKLDFVVQMAQMTIFP